MPVAVIEGRELYYEDSGGDGRAVLLLHGFPLESAMWAPQIEALGGEYRIIAPDLPGFGRSAPPQDPMTWRLSGYADAAKGLLDRLGIERVVLGGFSMGGYAAFSFLRRHPGVAEALVLVDTRSGADSLEAKEARTTQQEEVQATGIEALAERLLAGLLAPKNLGDPLLCRRVRALMEQPASGYVAALEAMKRRHDVTPELGRIELPTLVVVGAEDQLTPPPVVRAMAEAIPGARLVEIPGAGHLSNFEEPAAFNEALASFLGGL